MASPTHMQDGGQDTACPLDVFHTPPEDSSLPSSDDHLLLVSVSSSDLDLSSVNHAVHVGTQGSVNLCGYSDLGKGKGSVLGFDSEIVSEVEGDDAFGDNPECIGDEIRASKSESLDSGFSECQVVDAESVVEFEGGGVSGDVFQSNVDEIMVLKRGSSGSGESSVKKLELSEQGIGFGSSEEFLGAESQKTEEGVENCKGKLVPEPQNLGSGENVETQEVVRTENKENAGAVNFSEAEKSPMSSNEVAEASETIENIIGMLKGRVIPHSLHACLNDIAVALVSKECVKIEDRCSYKMLKYVLEKYSEEDDLENIEWLDVFQNSGVTFPCPRWWPENYEELGFNVSGLKVERDWKGF